MKKFFSVVYVYDVIGVLHALYPDYQALVDFSKAQDVIPRFETVLGRLVSAPRLTAPRSDLASGFFPARPLPSPLTDNPVVPTPSRRPVVPPQPIALQP